MAFQGGTSSPEVFSELSEWRRLQTSPPRALDTMQSTEGSERGLRTMVLNGYVRRFARNRACSVQCTGLRSTTSALGDSPHIDSSLNVVWTAERLLSLE